MPSPQPTTLLMSGFVNHDTKRLVIERPDDFTFEPGQGTELMIDCDPWKGQGHPFTPTSLPADRVLEFMIKRYDHSDGFTRTLHTLEAGARLLVGDAFGTITYHGPGIFIAAGAGITPFLAIFRSIDAQGKTIKGVHKLLYSSKYEGDLICELELKHYLGNDAVFTFTRHQEPGHPARHIDAAFIEANMTDADQYFYVCGPEGFVESVNADLLSLGVAEDRLVYER